MVKKYIKQIASLPRRHVLIGLLVLVFFTQSAFVSIFLGPTSSIPIPPERFRITVATKMSHEMPYGGHGSYDLYIYYVGNKRYDYHGPNKAYAPKGEKYLLKYDTLYPGGDFEHVELKTEHPIFLPGENTKYTVGTLKKVHKGFFSLDYVYTILGKEYSTSQSLADPAKKYPQLVTGAEFLVEYWVNNPERAILYMDKPKKDNIPFPASPDIHVLRPVWDSIPVVLPNHKW